MSFQINLPRVKATLLLAMFASLVLALAGCGGGDDTTDGSGGVPAGPETEAPAAASVEPMPLVNSVEVQDEWTAELFNFPGEELVGQLAQIRRGTTISETLAEQRALLEAEGWLVADVVADNITADANGQCDPRVFSVIGDDAALEALRNGQIVVADSPDGDRRAVYYVGEAGSAPNFLFKARNEWPELVAVASIGGRVILALTASHEHSKGILWGNFTDGVGGDNPSRTASPECEADLADGPFEIG